MKKKILFFVITYLSCAYGGESAKQWCSEMSDLARNSNILMQVQAFLSEIAGPKETILHAVVNSNKKPFYEIPEKIDYLRNNDFLDDKGQFKRRLKLMCQDSTGECFYKEKFYYKYKACKEKLVGEVKQSHKNAAQYKEDAIAKYGDPRLYKYINAERRDSTGEAY